MSCPTWKRWGTEMKIYLDDIKHPDWYDAGDAWADWVIVRTIAVFEQLLNTGLVTEVSLDHDLSTSDPSHTGFDAIEALKRYCGPRTQGWPRVRVHSSHPKNAESMRQAWREFLEQQE